MKALQVVIGLVLLVAGWFMGYATSEHEFNVASRKEATIQAAQNEREPYVVLQVEEELKAGDTLCVLDVYIAPEHGRDTIWVSYCGLKVHSQAAHAPYRE